MILNNNNNKGKRIKTSLSWRIIYSFQSHIVSLNSEATVVSSGLMLPLQYKYYKIIHNDIYLSL